MRFLLDEDLDGKTARAVDAISDDEFRHLLEFAAAGTQDGDIPALCNEHGFNVLVTANVKDFGARKVYYQALLNEGVSVVVLRPPSKHYKMTVPHQVSMLSNHLDRVRSLLAEGEVCLVKVTLSGAERRTLDQLLDEIGADEGKPKLP